jgi:colanic acid/amylovoran biosynthesis glycosyltransferase
MPIDTTTSGDITPMRLAIILNSFPELSETFITNHIAGEIDGGMDVSVISAHKSAAKKRHAILEKYDFDSRVTYLRIPRSMFPRLFRAPFLFLALLVLNPPAALEALKFRRYQTVSKNFKLLYFGLFFRKNRFDVVHCHFGMNGLIGAYLKTCGFCKKVVTTFHGADINSYPGKYGAGVYKYLYLTSDVITANTQFTKQKVMDNGGPGTIRVIPESLFVDDFINSGNYEKVPHSVITVGRLEEKKGYFYSLEAVALAKKKIPGIVYYIAGMGTLREKLEGYAKSLGIAEACHFLGGLTDVEVKERYKRCEIFLLSSITASNGDMEGQGLVIQEAQASGLPVISTLHNGIPDGLIKGKTGFLVPEKDSEALAEKIVLLLGDDKLRETMGRDGQIFVKQKYDVPIVVGQYNDCYGIAGMKFSREPRHGKES